MRVLTRTWQLLLKSLEEISSAPNPMMAAEMAIIRITHISDSPTPEELIKKLTNTQTEGTATQKLNPTKTVNSSGQSIYKPFQKSEINSSENNGNTALAIDTETLAIQYPTFESVLEIIRKFQMRV